MTSTSGTPTDPPPQKEVSLEADTNTNTSPEPTVSTPPVIPSTTEVVAQAIVLDPVQRFYYLLAHAKLLIHHHGPHTTSEEAKIFARASIPRSTTTENLPSTRTLALSFAAAQDALDTVQPAGPAEEDLQIFSMLWELTVEIMEHILDERKLDFEASAWGIYGLASGFVPTPTGDNSPATPAETPRDEFMPGDEHIPRELPNPEVKRKASFGTLKRRLHRVLTLLPTLSPPEHERHAFIGPPAARLSQLIKVQREMHSCAMLLVQEMREEKWANVRWWHGVTVVERWLGSLGGQEHDTSVVDGEREPAEEDSSRMQDS